jgi:hypothetical protein
MSKVEERIKLRQIMATVSRLPVEEPRCIIKGNRAWGGTFYVSRGGSFTADPKRACEMSVVQAKGILMNCPLLRANGQIVLIGQDDRPNAAEKHCQEIARILWYDDARDSWDLNKQLDYVDALGAIAEELKVYQPK